VKNAASSVSADDPVAAAQTAAAAAAQRYAPGLLRWGSPTQLGVGPSRNGRWVRRGSQRDHRQQSRIHIRPAEDIMHDIDRTQLESDFEGEFGWAGESESVFSETDEMELASQLLEVQDEQELDQFLGGLIKKVGGFIRSPAGRAIGGVLKGLAKKALPLAGTALGTFVGGPLGAQIGSGLASAAGSALGLESETWSQEDREFEGAKQFVRIAGEAVKNAASAGPGMDPRSAAQAAVVQAAQTLAPGLLQSASSAGMRPYGGASGGGHQGRWMRRGSKIVLYGV
jgi:hypothetical protein